MSITQRITAVIAVAAVAAVTFVTLKPDDDRPATAPAPPRTTPATATSKSPTTTTGTEPEAAPALITVKNGRPLGGIATISVRRGDRLRFRVQADAPETAHLHGYDIAKPVGPDQPARFSVPASITGVFEVELENSGVPVAKVTVNP
jgi:FtsP/CotA-like multicopper oxidase with cupredoxin domain